MKPFLTITFLLLLLNISRAQDSSFHLLKYYPGEIADAVLDNLDNLYLLSTTGQLKKYNAQGDSMAVYNNIRKLGKPYAIDVTNPLKILLFYKDFSTIVILDRLLGVRATIDMRRQNILQATAVGLSYDNNIWVYDGYDNKLKKINEQGNVLLETPDFRQLFNEASMPQQIIDHNKMVYVYDSATGIYAFDYYGTFKRKIPVKGWQGINMYDNYILGIVNSNSLHMYNTSSLVESHYNFPGNFTPYYRYNLINNKLLAISKEGLNIYRYK